MDAGSCDRASGRRRVIFPRFRDGSDTSPFADRLLAETGTAVVPGRFFEAPSHMRISFGGRPEVVAGSIGTWAGCWTRRAGDKGRGRCMRNQVRSSMRGADQGPPGSRTSAMRRAAAQQSHHPRRSFSARVGSAD